jgi:hypothetical protein
MLLRQVKEEASVGKLGKSLDLGSRVLWVRLPPEVQCQECGTSRYNTSVHVTGKYVEINMQSG